MFIEILPWTPLQLLARHNFLPCSLFAHIFPMNNLPSHIRINVFFHILFLLLCSPGLEKHTPSTHLVSLLWPLLELVPLVQWKLGNPPLQSMASSSFKIQWKLRMIFPPIDFRMKFFGPNETLKRFHPLIK